MSNPNASYHPKCTSFCYLSLLLVFAKQTALFLFIYCNNTEWSWHSKEQVENVSMRILICKNQQNQQQLLHIIAQSTASESTLELGYCSPLWKFGHGCNAGWQCRLVSKLWLNLSYRKPESGLGRQPAQCILVVAGFLSSGQKVLQQLLCPDSRDWLLSR